ncbi:hypothetical protein DFH29DRAFT_880042 [Suillus ampliporus]|nr:hypothetical protein DFH29DRAFT_880042 [Suillus ampliporus]
MEELEIESKQEEEREHAEVDQSHAPGEHRAGAGSTAFVAVPGKWVAGQPYSYAKRSSKDQRLLRRLKGSREYGKKNAVMEFEDDEDDMVNRHKASGGDAVSVTVEVLFTLIYIDSPIVILICPYPGGKFKTAIILVSSTVIKGKMSQELGWPRDDGDLSMLIDTDVNRSVDSGFIDLTTEAPAQTSHLSTRGSRMSTHERISSALKILRDGRISILDLLVKIMDPSQMLYSTYRDRMYMPSATEKQSGNGRLEKVLDFLWDDPRSHSKQLFPLSYTNMHLYCAKLLQALLRLNV